MSDDNSKKELNIKSTTIEQGIKSISSFLDKLVSPPIEELGLLVQDRVRYFRVKNQIKILKKAEELISENKVKVKKIPTKILTPLLDNCSLESEEELQNCWSNMIMNMADSSQNLQNQVFPYILSQISIQEWNALKKMISLATKSIKKKTKTTTTWDDKPLTEEDFSIRDELFDYNYYKNDSNKLEISLFELENLNRLGIVTYALRKIEVHNMLASNGVEESKYIEVDYEREKVQYQISELGLILINLCLNKKLK